MKPRKPNPKNPTGILSYAVTVRDTFDGSDFLLAQTMAPPPPTLPPDPGGWDVIAETGDLAGDVTVAPIMMGSFVGSASNDPYGSSASQVVLDPTGSPDNVIEVVYTRDNVQQSPDINRSIKNRAGSGGIGLGDVLRVEMEFWIPQDDDRDQDQRKLCYFKAKTVKLPSGQTTYSSHFVLKREGASLKTTFDNPMWQTSGTKYKVYSFAGQKVPNGVWHRLEWECHMNTQPFTAGVPGDGTIIVWVNGEEVFNQSNVVIMNGFVGPNPLTTFQIGEQWQSSPVDKNILWTEPRYFKNVRVMRKQTPGRKPPI